MMLLYLVAFFVVAYECQGHGWLKDPPSRSSMWMYGFLTPPNYNHMSLYCGRYYVQLGKCSVCGDPWNGPRDNEAGGHYATGMISRKYQEGQIINVQVKITAQHLGYFEFRVCPNNDPTKKVSQECLNKYILHQPNGNERYELHGPVQTYNVQLVLPMGLTCTQCVFQWTWHAKITGEEYRNCADIAIHSVYKQGNGSLSQII